MSRIHYRNFKGITALARDLRRNQTPSEVALLDILRKRKVDGYKFLRQHPVFYRIDREWVEFYIADFYCAELKLIIEVDGPIHGEKKEYDSERDLRLSDRGFSVLRIKNDEVKNYGSVLEKIQKCINKKIL